MMTLKTTIKAIIGMDIEQAQAFLFDTAENTATSIENYIIDMAYFKHEGYAVMYKRKFTITAHGAHCSGDRKMAYIFINAEGRIIGSEKADKYNRLKPISILQ